jgi:CDP-4-dehydro-6-deoxyglucose reductase
LTEKEKSVIKPAWHGIPRDEIDWHPKIEPELCIGCGLCVIGCGKRVYKFDFESNIPIVANPKSCVVGCTTCANTCPQHAISFPPMSYLHKLIRKNRVIQRSRKTLLKNRDRLLLKR